MTRRKKSHILTDLHREPRDFLLRFARRAAGRRVNSKCLPWSVLGKGGGPACSRLMKWTSRWFCRVLEALRARPFLPNATYPPRRRALWKAV
ncbi:hypothetical protein EYF80_055005 [Liparis tanakae]|uniref:Uncharacterized protein n=1 Tax=Liparis tanakae TaxID=230148 RepID=A0A4Z2F2V8_9TELE|nr:hypothetical protein EYF80_055005 [Liparis tanakae]